MGHDDYIDESYPDLPPEAGTNTHLGYQVNHGWIEGAKAELRYQAMRIWFLSRYCDPAYDTPYNGKEGGYLYIYGGPYDASEELQGQFGGLLPDEEIQAVVEDVESDGILEWAPIHKEGYYDNKFQFVVNTCNEPFYNFSKRIEEVESLKSMQVDYNQQLLLYQLLFSSLITVLETYLQDTMSFWIDIDEEVFRNFVANCEEFKRKKLNLSEIFNRMDGIKNEVHIYLQELVWHRLDKVAPLMAGSLKIAFPSLEPLMKHILRRHDIVHRGGKDKDGNMLAISINNM